MWEVLIQIGMSFTFSILHRFSTVAWDNFFGEEIIRTLLGEEKAAIFLISILDLGSSKISKMWIGHKLSVAV